MTWKSYEKREALLCGGGEGSVLYCTSHCTSVHAPVTGLLDWKRYDPTREDSIPGLGVFCTQ